MTDYPLRHLRLLLFVPLTLWALAACGPREDTTPQTQPQDAPGVTTTPDPAPEAVPPAGTDPLMTEPAETPAEPAEIEAAEEAEEEAVEEETAEAEVVITMENVGNEAWVVSGIDGNQNVASVDEENPTLTLQVGNRYRIENLAAAEHPLELLDADGNVLLAQGGAGTLADDGEIAYAEDANGVSFTLTEALAEQLAGYQCGVHPEMAGDIEIAQAE
jgi:hypothetical protein